MISYNRGMNVAIVQLQIEIFMIVICGYILAKKDIINVDTRKRLTGIVINLILPFAIQLVYSVLNKFLYRHFDETDHDQYRMSMAAAKNTVEVLKGSYLSFSIDTNLFFYLQN